MQTTYFSVLPANVRYDKSLDPMAKLLYSEITAGVSTAGECDENVVYFGEFLKCSVRTAYRYLKDLEEANHIKRTKLNGRKIITLVLEPRPVEKETVVSDVEANEITDFFNKFLNRFEEGMGVSLNKRDLLHNILFERLKTFSKNELTMALENRLKLIKASDWHQDPVNKSFSADIMLLIQTDNAILKALNLKFEETPENTFKPLTFD